MLGCDVTFPKFEAQNSTLYDGKPEQFLTTKVINLDKRNHSIMINFNSTGLSLQRFSDYNDPQERIHFGYSGYDHLNAAKPVRLNFEFDQFNPDTHFAIASYNMEEKSVYVVKCNKNELSCIKVGNATLEGNKVDAMIPRPNGIFLHKRLERVFLLMDYNFEFSKVQVFKYTHEMRDVVDFNGKWLGVTEDSVYILSVKQDGYFEKQTLLFTCMGHIHSLKSSSSKYLLINYDDTPKLNKTILFIEEPKNKLGWSSFDLNLERPEDQILDIIEWRNFLLFWTEKNVVLFNPPKIDLKSQMDTETSSVSVFDKKEIGGKILTVVPYGEKLDEFVVIVENDQKEVKLSKMKIGAMSLDCKETSNQMTYLLGNSISLKVGFRDQHNSNDTVVDYNITFVKGEEQLNNWLILSCALLLGFFVCLFGFTFMNIQKVAKRRKRFRSVLKKYLKEVKRSMIRQKTMVDNEEEEDLVAQFVIKK
jgi:hypothetical protein